MEKKKAEVSLLVQEKLTVVAGDDSDEEDPAPPVVEKTYPLPPDLFQFRVSHRTKVTKNARYNDNIINPYL